MGTVQIKRIYEPLDKADGKRILVDRLWPRGVSKEAAHLDEWLKAVSPSTELRKWFGHDVVKWEEFKGRYMLELKENRALDTLMDIVRTNKTVTLLYAAHDEQHNHALVLRDIIDAAAAE